MARSVIIYYENISNLMAFGTARPSQKCRQFFYVPFRERGFRQVTFLKGDKSPLSNIVIFYIIGMQTLYWFENTKKSMPENQYLSQYFVGLPSKISSFIKRRIDITSLIGAYPSPV